MLNQMMVDPHHLDVNLLAEKCNLAKQVLDGMSPPQFWKNQHENGEF